MQPHSLSTLTLTNAKTPAQRKAEAGWAGRHGKFEKGTVLPETQVQACPRVKVADLPEGFLKKSHIEHLEHNQQIASCCRNPENHEVAAFKSHPDETLPDLYIFYCMENHPPVFVEIDGKLVDVSPPYPWREHRFFCVGMTDERPSWDAG